MQTEFRMPSLGADMEDGILLRWLVAPGDAVQRGQVVAIVETAKGAIDIEIFKTGKMRTILVEPGSRVPVGEVLALVDVSSDEDVAETEVPTGGGSSAVEPRGVPPETGPSPIPATRVGARRRISPAARRRASEVGVDIETVQGSGPDGAVTLADLEHKASTPSTARGMRETIAAAMARSKREIPHYYLSTEIDLEPLFTWLEAENAERPVSDRLLPVALLAKASVSALKKHTQLNGFWRKGAYQPADGIHLGFAVALRGGGLIAPAIQSADSLSLNELMAAILDLVKRARSGGLRGSELSEPTITLTSLGDLGVDCLYPIIYPPQVAIVGFGTPVSRPWVVGNEIRVRRVVQATLAADHRASDGHLGGRFLRRVAQILGEPQSL